MGPSASPIICPTCGAANTPQARYCSTCGVSVGGQAQESGGLQDTLEYGLHRCSFHPDVETGLSCGKCGQYICPRCVIQTPVGGRCSDCARVVRHPTFDVSTTYYVRASVAAAGVGILGGLLWGLFLNLGIPFLPWLLTGAIGYAMGEVVSLASNRKRGQGLVAIAVGGVTLALVVMVSVVGVFNVVFLLIFAALAYYMAVMRVR